MEITPTKKGLLVLAVHLALPGMLLAALALLFRPWLGGCVLGVWLAAGALAVRFGFAVQRAEVSAHGLTARWGTAFPQQRYLPLNGQVLLLRFSTPVMRLVRSNLLVLRGPGGSIWLWAVSDADADALASRVP